MRFPKSPGWGNLLDYPKPQKKQQKMKTRCTPSRRHIWAASRLLENVNDMFTGFLDFRVLFRPHLIGKSRLYLFDTFYFTFCDVNVAQTALLGPLYLVGEFKAPIQR